METKLAQSRWDKGITTMTLIGVCLNIEVVGVILWTILELIR